MRSRVAWSGLFVAATAGCGAAPVSEPVEQASSMISGGTLDADDAAVFEVVIHFGDLVASCTASLIAPNVLLTARHCVSEAQSENVVCGHAAFSAPVAGSDTFATNATQPTRKSTFYQGADVRVPSEGADICGFDMALIILATPVPAAQATPLVPRIDQPVVPGEPYRAVGYGVDEVGESNPGRMERGDLEVACLPAECPRGAVAESEFMGETGVCSGDSGGPAIDEEGRVIGVVSRGSEPCETPIYGSVSAWGTWLTETVLDAAASAGYRAPFWAYSGSSELDPTLANDGDRCTDTSECSPGMACYYESEPSDAVCTPVCANARQCASDQECRDGFDVPGGGLCLGTDTVAPPEKLPTHGAEDTCSVGAGGRGSPASAWLLALVGLAGVARSRSRRGS